MLFLRKKKPLIQSNWNNERAVEKKLNFELGRNKQSKVKATHTHSESRSLHSGV